MKSVFKNDVISILTERPETRDDIDTLCYYIAKNKKLNCKDVLVIDRLSRYYQKEMPELR